MKARKADLPGERTGDRARRGGARAPAWIRGELRRRLDAFTARHMTLSRSRAGSTAMRRSCSASARDELPGIVVEAEPVRQYLDEHGKVDGR